MGKTVLVRVAITPEEWKSIRVEAIRAEKSVSQYVAEILRARNGKDSA